eukprot:TRINITY_DN70017_c0_g1_i1.p1 TRINITY_DN70017_c0_g1~~TRINITY_DN70017_c0_g1_i1.p1  ORF type:complete len:524 (+),score=149.70 TRINITY_DN70017_c0_g1_i1:87-1574(+)
MSGFTPEDIRRHGGDPSGGFASILQHAPNGPTNEGDGVVPDQSLRSPQPRVPPGFIGAEYSWDERSHPPGCKVTEVKGLGCCLVATRDFEVGDCILEDEALLQVPWDLDLYLTSPEPAVRGLIAKMVAKYGRAPLDQGYVQVVARFLEQALRAPRSSKALIWGILSSWFCPSPDQVGEEGMAQTRAIAHAIHSCLPSRFQGLISEDEVVRLLLVYDVNSLTSRVNHGHTSVFAFARLAEHHCNPNATFVLLDYPKDEWPARVQFRAQRPIREGERVSISYIPGYMRTSERQRELQERYYFHCACSACTVEPDLARGFKCWLCEKNQGVISPVGLGDKEEDWRCMQCGVMLETHRVQDCIEAEKKLQIVKADKWKGITQLMGDEVMHYSHYLCFRKLDEWAQRAWMEKDGLTTANMVEALIKCVDRVFPKFSPAKAQYHEFVAQVRHGLGEAHTARAHYVEAYRIREAAGHQHSWWSQKTKYMAFDKPLTELMDAK